MVLGLRPAEIHAALLVAVAVNAAAGFPQDTEDSRIARFCAQQVEHLQALIQAYLKVRREMPPKAPGMGHA